MPTYKPSFRDLYGDEDDYIAPNFCINCGGDEATDDICDWCGNAFDVWNPRRENKSGIPARSRTMFKTYEESVAARRKAESTDPFKPVKRIKNK